MFGIKDEIWWRDFMNLVNFSSGDKVMYKDMIGVIDSVEYEHIKIKLEDNLYIVVNIEDVELIE